MDDKYYKAIYVEHRRELGMFLQEAEFVSILRQVARDAVEENKTSECEHLWINGVTGLCSGCGVVVITQQENE